MIQRLGVIGAGSMGAAIAGLAASAGISVVLLDVRDPDDPAGPARRGLERARAQRALLDPRAIDRIQVGNIEDNLDLLATCDWVLEAIIEDLEAKRSLFQQLASILSPTTILTTNTSTFPLEQLLPHESPAWRARFFATHFFNPPRALLLTELAALPAGADQHVFDGLRRFLEQRLGRRVLVVKSSPGFVANRFGIYALVHAIQLTDTLGLTLEEADALTGPLLGRPRSATFRTIDLTGLDILVLGTRSLQASTGDDYRLPSWVLDLYQQGRFGDKAGAGLFRTDGDQSLTFDPKVGGDRPTQPATIPGLVEASAMPFPQRLQQALHLPDPYGMFVRHLLGRTFWYVLARTPDVAHDLVTVDCALEWGFGWTAGPYQQMDMLGLSTVRSLITEAGQAPPPLLDAAEQAGGFYRDDCVLDLATGTMRSRQTLPVARRINQVQTRTALTRQSILPLTEDVIAIRPERLTDLSQTIDHALTAQWPTALVLVPSFQPPGYPYESIIDAAEHGDWSTFTHLLKTVHDAVLALAEIPVPIVVMLDGDARGAATMCTLWADGTVAYLTSIVGFPGASHGLYPFGALSGLLWQANIGRTEPPAAQPPEHGGWLTAALTLCANETVFSSAAEAAQDGLLGHNAAVLLDRDGLLDNAVALARILGARIPTRPSSHPLKHAAATDLDMLLASLPQTPIAQTLAATMAPALRTATTARDLLAAELEAWHAMLHDPNLRSQAATALQKVRPRR